MESTTYEFVEGGGDIAPRAPEIVAAAIAKGLYFYDEGTDSYIRINADSINAANVNHSHNNIASRGTVTAESGITDPAVGGMSMSQAYSNGYPYTYGNVITLNGAGKNELFLGWSGTSGANAPSYLRNQRDTDDANWSSWEQIATTAYPEIVVSSAQPSNTNAKIWIQI